MTASQFYFLLSELVSMEEVAAEIAVFLIIFWIAFPRVVTLDLSSLYWTSEILEDLVEQRI